MATEIVLVENPYPTETVNDEKTVVHSVRAKWAFETTDEKQLAFPEGAIIEVTQQLSVEDGWWFGQYNENQGLFPINRTEVFKVEKPVYKKILLRTASVSNKIRQLQVLIGRGDEIENTQNTTENTENTENKQAKEQIEKPKEKPAVTKKKPRRTDAAVNFETGEVLAAPASEEESSVSEDEESVESSEEESEISSYVSESDEIGDLEASDDGEEKPDQLGLSSTDDVVTDATPLEQKENRELSGISLDKKEEEPNVEQPSVLPEKKENVEITPASTISLHKSTLPEQKEDDSTEPTISLDKKEEPEKPTTVSLEKKEEPEKPVISLDKKEEKSTISLDKKPEPENPAPTKPTISLDKKEEPEKPVISLDKKEEKPTKPTISLGKKEEPENPAPKKVTEKKEEKEAAEHEPAHNIWTACKLGEFERVKYLVQQGQDVNAKDNEGNSALHIAAANSKYDIILFLLSQGATIGVLNARNEMPHTQATVNNNVRQVLLENLEHEPHWIPDSTSPSCLICSKGFTFFSRRHHCRNCGILACGSCTGHKVPIPNIYKTHSNQRVCNYCQSAIAAKAKQL